MHRQPAPARGRRGFGRCCPGPWARPADPGTKPGSVALGAELFLTEEEEGGATAPAACLPEGHLAQPLWNRLRQLLVLSRVLQARRVAQGAVITERPMPEVTLAGEGSAVTVVFSDEPQTPLAHTVVGENNSGGFVTAKIKLRKAELDFR